MIARLYRQRVVYYCILATIMQVGRQYVPYFMLRDRFGGAIFAILVATLMQTVVAYLFISAMGRAKNKTIVDILYEKTNRWIAKGILCWLGATLFMAGMLNISYTVKAIQLYINSGFLEWTLVLMLAVSICYAATIQTSSVLYALDILLLINFPIYLFLLLKLSTDMTHSIDSIAEILTHSLQLPSVMAIVASSFNLSGFILVAIFQPLVQDNSKIKYLWSFSALQCVTQIIVFLLPITFFGTVGAGMYYNPILAVADSSHLPYFFIERVVFIVYLVHSSVSFIHTAMCWHVSVRVFAGCKKPSQGKVVLSMKNSGLKRLIPISIFAAASVLIHMYFNTQREMITFHEIWYGYLFGTTTLITGMLYWTMRKEKWA